MKRSDMMVGIDGTAQGRINRTDSALIQQRDQHLEVDRDDQEHECVEQRPEEDRIFEQVHIGVRAARHPEPVSDRVENEENENQDVGDDQDDAPSLPRRHPSRNRRTAAVAPAQRDRRHAATPTTRPSARAPGRVVVSPQPA
jgi:hypothetical protein